VPVLVLVPVFWQWRAALRSSRQQGICGCQRALAE